MKRLILLLVVIAGFGRITEAGSYPLQPFVVDTGTFASGDINLGDGVCDVDIAVDSEACTLRGAIEEANALGAGPYVINVDLDPSEARIVLTTPLPNITTPVILDATTNSGTLCPTVNSAAVLTVELDGSGLAANEPVLTLGPGSSGSELRGFAIRAAESIGVRIVSDDNSIGCNVIVGSNIAGVFVAGERNRIGGSTFARRNVISGHRHGVDIVSGAEDTQILGNFIGTDETGQQAMPNLIGIQLEDADAEIGGLLAAQRNVISGNSGTGVVIKDSDATFLGNFIGVDASGSAELGNQINGITASNSTLVIGESGEAPNIISGNGAHGIEITFGAISVITNNYIGTDITGLSPLGNGGAGIYALNGQGRIILENIISANLASGIEIVDSNLDVVQQNQIGIAANGTPLGNGLHGIDIGTAMFSVVQDNDIANNQRAGIRLGSTQATLLIQENRIKDNRWLGIDIGPAGVTESVLIPFPTITAANADTGSVSAQLNGAPNRSYQIDVFASGRCDATGFGEGERWLGSIEAVTDSSGFASGTQTFMGFTTGDYLTMTATDGLIKTSEFSACYHLPVPTVITLASQAMMSEIQLQVIGGITLLTVLTSLSLAHFFKETHNAF